MDDHRRCHEIVKAVAEQAGRERLAEPAWWGQAVPYLVFALLMACIMAGVDGSWPVVVISLLLGGYCHVLMAFLGHDAGHNAYSRNPYLNAFMGLWMFAHSFTNYFGFRVMHWGHHKYTGFDEDPSGDSPKFASTVGLGTYSLFVLLPLGFPALVIVPSWLGGIGFQPKVYRSSERHKIRWAMLFLVGYHLAFHRVLTLLAGEGAYLFFLGTYVLGLWLTTMVLALSHAGVEMYTDCKLCNTRTVTSDNLFDVLTANGGYHVEHHIAPQVPWYRMKRIHQLLMQQGGYRGITRGFGRLHLQMYRLYWKNALVWVRSLVTGVEYRPGQFKTSADRVEGSPAVQR